ncbi:hypothetical protein [Lysinibacillus sp. NPDC096212]|uniref:hypothetical protein n=1 Tax=Lysinibacillus sp. NPDC096212 TaxID=3364135 RepID=UPI00380B0347
MIKRIYKIVDNFFFMPQGYEEEEGLREWYLKYFISTMVLLIFVLITFGFQYK